MSCLPSSLTLRYYPIVTSHIDRLWAPPSPNLILVALEWSVEEYNSPICQVYRFFTRIYLLPRWFTDFSRTGHIYLLSSSRYGSSRTGLHHVLLPSGTNTSLSASGYPSSTTNPTVRFKFLSRCFPFALFLTSIS